MREDVSGEQVLRCNHGIVVAVHGILAMRMPYGSPVEQIVLCLGCDGCPQEGAAFIQAILWAPLSSLCAGGADTPAAAIISAAVRAEAAAWHIFHGRIYDLSKGQAESLRK